jgi:type II secretion system (T2SS) protein M
MTLQPRDRRALTYLGLSAALSLVIYFWPQGGAKVPAPVVSGDSVSSAEKRLARLRNTAATVPEKEQILKDVRATLAKREAGLIQADTAAQAQAQLLQILRRLCASENPPIEIRATELTGVTPLGDSYGLANLAIQINCPIEQVVNLLAAIAAQPELITTTELRVAPVGNPRDKLVEVRLAVAGVVPDKLVPRRNDKKGAGG